MIRTSFINGEIMAIEVELPQEIELKIRANKDLDLLVRKRLEHQIKRI